MRNQIKPRGLGFRDSNLLGFLDRRSPRVPNFGEETNIWVLMLPEPAQESSNISNVMLFVNRKHVGKLVYSYFAPSCDPHTPKCLDIFTSTLPKRATTHLLT